jgi:hypothetical protein
MAHVRGDSYHLRKFVLDKADSETMSRSATQYIFQWSLSNELRADDNGLWEREWLRDSLEDESESEDEDDNVEAALHTSIGKLINTIYYYLTCASRKEGGWWKGTARHQGRGKVVNQDTLQMD